jgi:hypothetical protein
VKRARFCGQNSLLRRPLLVPKRAYNNLANKGVRVPSFIPRVFVSAELGTVLGNDQLRSRCKFNRGLLPSRGVTHMLPAPKRKHLPSKLSLILSVFLGVGDHWSQPYLWNRSKPTSRTCTGLSMEGRTRCVQEMFRTHRHSLRPNWPSAHYTGEPSRPSSGACRQSTTTSCIKRRSARPRATSTKSSTGRASQTGRSRP